MADDNPFATPAPKSSSPKPEFPPVEVPKLYVPNAADRVSNSRAAGMRPASRAAAAPGATRLLIPALGYVYAVFAPITELLIRLMAGGSLAYHGYQILFGNIEGAGRFFESLDFQNGLLWAWVVGILELVCGFCLAVGLFTRLAAGPILVFLIVSIVLYHLDFGYDWEARGIEFPLFWAIVVFHFLVRGGGRWSFDRLIGREI